MPATVTRLYEEASFEARVRAASREAAVAFRVLRDARVMSPVSQLRFLARIGPADLVELSHPGPWSVSLEPRVRLFTDAPAGGSFSVRDLAAAPFADAFRSRGDLQALALLSSPYLSIVAAGGEGLDLTHPPAAGRSAARRLALAEGSAADQFARTPAADPAARAVLLRHGELLAWSDEGLLALAEWLMALEEAARLAVEGAAYRAAARR